MNTRIEAVNLNPYESTEICHVELPLPRKCPRCQTGLSGEPISSHYLDSASSGRYMYSIYFCPFCEKCFFIEYSVWYNGASLSANPLLIYPNINTTTTFSKNIETLSPDFVEIYHQSEVAENVGLPDIAGLGYRKALEFLIKDYATYEHPEDSDIIKKKPLAQCIASYISNDSIATLAERSTWIGNDEAHYIRKHQNLNVSDMKSFIEAIVYFIGIGYVTKNAASIDPKK